MTKDSVFRLPARPGPEQSDQRQPDQAASFSHKTEALRDRPLLPAGLGFRQGHAISVISRRTIFIRRDDSGRSRVANINRRISGRTRRLTHPSHTRLSGGIWAVFCLFRTSLNGIQNPNPLTSPSAIASRVKKALCAAAQSPFAISLGDLRASCLPGWGDEHARSDSRHKRARRSRGSR